MKIRAFTLIELMVCVAIVAIVAAIMFPVFARAKRSAKITASTSNLRQMHLAIKLYQMDHDGDGKYGSLSDMGLPPFGWHAADLLPTNMWQSPCGLNPSWFDEPIVVQYNYYPIDGFDHWEKVAPIYQENLVIFADMNCAAHGEPLYSDNISHRGIGVLLSGTLLNLNKPGDARFQKWWTSLPSQ